MQHLLQAERSHPAQDVAYLVFAARRIAEDMSGNSKGMSALSRISFEKHLADAHHWTLRAMMRQVDFWHEMADSRPDLSKLHSVSTQLNSALDKAERCYQELLTLNSQSLMVLRRYANMQLCILNDVDKVRSSARPACER